MDKRTISRYMTMVTRIDQHGNRAVYHIGNNFQVDVSRCEMDLESKNSLMNRWKKAGYISDVMPSYLCVNTYYYDGKGDCWGKYNIFVKERDNGPGIAINFDYLREATPENEAELVAECIRLYLAENE